MSWAVGDSWGAAGDGDLLSAVDGLVSKDGGGQNGKSGVCELHLD